MDVYNEILDAVIRKQFYKHDKCRQYAYICSPLRGTTEKEVSDNIYAARAYMYYAITKLNMAARAPHAYLPNILCDAKPSERALALNFGLRLLENSDILLVCGNRITNGMLGEISHAAGLNMPIIVFSSEIYTDVKKLVTKCGGDKRNVKFDGNNPEMGFIPCDLSVDEVV